MGIQHALVKTSGDFPEQAEADIVRDYKQLRGKCDKFNKSDEEKVRFAGKCTLLAQAIGSNGKPVDCGGYFVGRALTLSLAEVFRDYHLITTAKELHEHWIKGFAVVGHRTRSMSSGSQGSREPALGGKGKGSKGKHSHGSSQQNKRRR